MSNCLEGRRTARQLAKRLARSVLRDGWGNDRSAGDGGFVPPIIGATTLRRGPYTIVIIPQRLRILDRIEVYHRGNDIWIPLRARLCLRSAVRFRLAKLAMAESWPEEYDPESR